MSDIWDDPELEDDGYIETIVLELDFLQTASCENCNAIRRKGKFVLKDRYIDREEYVMALPATCCNIEIKSPMLFMTYEDASLYLSFLRGELPESDPAVIALRELEEGNITFH